MKTHRTKSVFTILMTAVLAVVFGAALIAPFAAPASAAPSFPGGSTRVSESPQAVTLYSGVITQSVQGARFSLGAYDRLDIQYIVTMGTANTTTLSMLHSNTGGAWSSGATLFPAITASGNSMTSTYNFGRYTTITATLTNNNPVTLTVIGWAK